MAKTKKTVAKKATKKTTKKVAAKKSVKKTVPVSGLAEETQAKIEKSKTKPAAKKPLNVSIAKESKEGDFVIEDGVPIPPVHRNRESKYPLRDLKKGQSLFIPAVVDTSSYKSPKEADRAFKEECRRLQNNLGGAKRRIEEQDKNYKFVVRITDKGVRVWRKE